MSDRIRRITVDNTQSTDNVLQLKPIITSSANVAEYASQKARNKVKGKKLITKVKTAPTTGGLLRAFPEIYLVDENGNEQLFSPDVNQQNNAMGHAADAADIPDNWWLLGAGAGFRGGLSLLGSAKDLIGRTAGGMATGMVADEVSKGFTGYTLGENARNAIGLFTGFKGFDNPVFDIGYNLITDMAANPWYFWEPRISFGSSYRGNSSSSKSVSEIPALTDVLINTPLVLEGTYAPNSVNLTKESLDKINAWLIARGVKPLESITSYLALGIEDFLKTPSTRFVFKDGKWLWIYSNDKIQEINVSSLVSPNFTIGGRRTTSFEGPVSLGLQSGPGSMDMGYANPYAYFIRFSSPAAEMEDITLPKFIPKDIVKEFSINMLNMVKPGSYITGDNGAYWPIGALLHKNAMYPERVRLILNTYPYIHGYNGAGLSTDSYDYLLKLGLRPEWELRYNVEFPMTGFNNLSYYGRKYMDMLNAAKLEKDPNKALMLKKQFINEYNNHLKLVNPDAQLAYLDNTGRVLIPHPYIYRIPTIAKNIDNNVGKGFIRESDIIMPYHPSYTLTRFDSPIIDVTGFNPTYVGEWTPNSTNTTILYFDNIILPKMGGKAPEDMNYTIRFGSTENTNSVGEHNRLTRDNYYFNKPIDKDGNVLPLDPREFKSTYIHEAESHGTDIYLEDHYPQIVLEYIDFTPTRSDFKDMGINMSDDADKWYEMRATLNEARFDMYNAIRKTGLTPSLDVINNAIDKMSDKALIQYIGDINGYGQYYLLYYNTALEKNPEAAKKLVDGMKKALKTLPLSAPLIIGTSLNNN